MDSDHLAEKSRRNNHRQLPESSKLDFFNFNSGLPEEKPNDFWTPSSRVASKKSSPESESNPKHWAIVSEGFPPGVTVDELKNYGRRRQLNHLRPQDNLQLEEGSLKAYKSEYKRRYQAYAPLKHLEVNWEEKKEKEKEEESAKCIPEYRKSFIDYPRGRPILKRPQNSLMLLRDHPMEISTEKNSQYVPFFNFERRRLLRRSTALKPEGDMTNETEVRREYRMYENPEKAQIIRRLPSLKLEGEFESMTTEQKDQFIAFLLGRRPVLEKKNTSLKMEGDFDFLTEKKLSYVPHKLSERPRIRKRSTSLKLDGEVEFFPEYRKSFVDFPRVRPINYKPIENIRHYQEGEFDRQTETKTKFINFENVSIPESAKPENNLHVEGEMEINPEYKINFIDFPRERPFVKRPMNQLKPEGNLQVLTESLERFSDLVGAEKSESLRRSNNLRLEGDFNFISENSEKFTKHENPIKPESLKQNSNLKLEGEIDFLTEKAEKFIGLTADKEGTARRPSSLKLDGELLFLPEYKRSYVDFVKHRSFPKTTQDLRPNMNSPRHKLDEKLKLNSEEDKKKIFGTPRRKGNVKRPKGEATEKNIKFEIPKEGSYKVDPYESDDKKESRATFTSNLKSPEKVGKKLESQEPLIEPKEFPAFHVLDVKGQIGCQSMMKNALEREKSTSDEENPTYRLEVSNSGKRSPGFYKSHQRVFPTPAVEEEILKEAEKRARKRAENYVKVVKSPEIPNYLLEESDSEKENRWKDKIGSLTPPDIKKRAFVVLDEGLGDCQNFSIEQKI